MFGLSNPELGVLMLALFAPRMGLNLLRTQRPWLQLVRGLSLVAISLLMLVLGWVGPLTKSAG